MHRLQYAQTNQSYNNIDGFYRAEVVLSLLIFEILYNPKLFNSGFILSDSITGATANFKSILLLVKRPFTFSSASCLTLYSSLLFLN